MNRFFLPFLFAITMFVSAGLLFCVQPMIAKMILPILGGSPAVWIICMLFFQALLLAGYVWAHWVTSWSQARRQAVVQIVLILLPLVLMILPIRITASEIASVPHSEYPTAWLIRVLLLAVGLPFFVLSTTAPLLQKWLAAVGHAGGKDPYYLYGASNLGSMLALLGYPLWMEPRFSLGGQSWVWTTGYAVLVLLMIVSTIVIWKNGASASSNFMSEEDPSAKTGDETSFINPQSSFLDSPLSWKRRLRWLVLAFVPSSMMLGVTMYLTTDIAPIPLLWVIPLAIYLLTFILVFARWVIVPHWLMVRVLPVVGLILMFLLFAEDMKPPIWLLIPLHLLMLFTTAMVCHGELARNRPPAARLTEFYLWLALGGVLGGIFNGIIAPVIFRRVLEYPLAIILACLLRPPFQIRNPKSKIQNRFEAQNLKSETKLKRALRTLMFRISSLFRISDFGVRISASPTLLDWALPLLLGLLACALVFLLPRLGLRSAQWSVGLMAGVPAVICYFFVDRPLRFALGLGAMMLAGFFYTGIQGKTIFLERNFFGVVRVTQDRNGEYRQVVHGNTIHGRQSLDPARRHEPLAYFHKTGPIGKAFDFFNPNHPTARIGVIGLGAGSLACYALPEQKWTFYEIDPAVEYIADHYFTFLTDCKAGRPDVIIGDARLRLQEAPDGCYDMIVLDAFSSDVVPIHLLTREALQLYLSKLNPAGILCFHCSSRYLELKPVLANLARDAGLACIAREDLNVTSAEKKEGKEPSQWVMMAWPGTDLDKLTKRGLWERMPGQHGVRVWTDDYSNILQVFKWELPEEKD
jgi:hypothetical protein